MKNLPKGSETQTAVRWDDDARIRTFAPKDHVTAFLALEHKSYFFERLPKFVP